MPPADPSSDTASGTAPHFLRLNKRGMGRLARSLRLREGDVLVAVNGEQFQGDAKALKAFFDADENSDESHRFLLTFWRKGVFFHLLVEAELKADFEFCDAETALEILRRFPELSFAPLETYEVYEVFRDIRRVCAMHSTKPDPLATYLPALWMLNRRLYYPMLAVTVVYAISLLAHWAMFLLAYLLISLYARRAQLTLLRSYQLFEERLFWFVLAERSEEAAQATCRLIDPEIRFIFDTAPPPKKKKRNSAAGAVASGRPGAA
jgi:hypothetical protein